MTGSSLFGEYDSVNDIDYDIVIYDTYDYLDKVISLSMSDPISAALEIYFDKTKDIRAIYLQNYLKYGTNDEVEIWLTKYGFSFEDIAWLKEHVEKVDSKKLSLNQRLMRFPLSRNKLYRDIFNLYGGFPTHTSC